MARRVTGLLERLRRVTRAFMGRTRAYSVLSRIAESAAIVRSDGFRVRRELSRLSRGNGGPAVTLRFRRLQHPFALRPLAEDVTTVINTVIREEWGQLPDGFAPSTMIDAGAYIGDTAAYYLSRFPQLSVIALEPNEESHLLAATNLVPYGTRATLLRSGLWSSEGELAMSGAFTHATMRVSDTGAAIPVTSVPSLLDRFGIARLDLLKMDIEGAELEIFASRADAWLSRVRMIVLEIHGEAAMTAVQSALRPDGFSMRRFRSVWYCERAR